MRKAALKLSDDDVRAILLAPAHVSHSELATRFGVDPNTIKSYRNRTFQRAIRIARELGIISSGPSLVGHIQPEYDDQRAYVVRGRR